MKPRFLLIVLFFSLLSTSCEEEFKRKYPIIRTAPPSSITPLGATFSATIEHAEGQAVIEHGFIWGGFPQPTMNLGPTTATEVSYQARSGMEVGEIKVKAYLKTATYTVYGEIIAFTCQGSEGPRVTGFSPTVAEPLDTITVFGKNFISEPMVIGTASNSFIGYTHETTTLGTSAKFVIPIYLSGTQTFFLHIADQVVVFPAPLEIN